MRWLRQSTAREVAIGPFLDETDGKTPETGLSITQAECLLKINEGDWAQKNDTTTPVHESNGWYRCLLNTTDTGTLGVVMLAVTKSGAVPIWHEFMVVTANIWDSYFSTDVLDTSVVQWLGTAVGAGTAGVPNVDITRIANAAVSTSTAQLGVNVVNFGGSAGAFASGRPEVNTTHAAGTAWDSGAITAASLSTGAITNAKFAAGAIDAAAIADGAIDAATLATGTITSAKFAAGAIDAAAIATAAIDADALATDAITALEISSSAITEIRSMANGTADSGTTTTMVDAARTEADTDYWKDNYIVFTSGNISGQSRLITGFNAGNDTITFTPATTQAVSTQTYEIWPGGVVSASGADPATIAAAVWNEDATGHQTAGTFGKAIGDPLTATNSLIQRTPDAVAGAPSGLFIAGTNAPTTVTTSFTTTFTGNLTGSVDSVTGLTASNLDATVSSRATPTTVWSEALPGSYTSGQAGNILGNALTATFIAKGTADSGTTTTMVDSARTEADTDYWKDSYIVFTSGNITGQSRLITGFNATNDTITFTPATTQAVSTNTYEIWPGGAVSSVTNMVTANVTQISGDGPAADNAESFFDGTGYAGTNNVIPTVTTTGTATNVTTVNGLSAATIDAIIDEPIEGGYTMRQLLKLISSALAGKVSGASGTTITFRDVNDTTDRIVATVDQYGNRGPTVTLNVT